MAPMVYLGSWPHRFHLPCYAALRVSAAADLSCPACRAIVTVGEADGIASRQHSDKIMAEALAVARQENPAEGGRGGIHKDHREREGRTIDMQHFAMDWLRRLNSCKCPARATCIAAALQAFARTQSPELDSSAGHAKPRARTPALHEVQQEVDTHPLLPQVRAYWPAGVHAGQRRFYKQGRRSRDSPSEQDPHSAGKGGPHAECRRVRRGEPLLVMA